jgi:hypothetical protein
MNTVPAEMSRGVSPAAASSGAGPGVVGKGPCGGQKPRVWMPGPYGIGCIPPADPLTVATDLPVNASTAKKKDNEYFIII